MDLFYGYNKINPKKILDLGNKYALGLVGIVAGSTLLNDEEYEKSTKDCQLDKILGKTLAELFNEANILKRVLYIIFLILVVTS